MTVTYSADVSTVRFTTFGKLIFRWRGSIWKSIFNELIIWMIAYASLSVLYNFVLSENYKRVFENICRLFTKYTDVMPITFMLGFFINIVVNRFWSSLRNIGWIDTSALYICKYISGSDDHARLLRRNIIRYLLFYQVLVYRDISEVIRRRFPSLETLVTAGYLTEIELMQFNAINSTNRKYWIPIHWAMGLARRARQEKRIDSPHALQDIFDKINNFRLQLAQLIIIDWVPIPLVYSQVICLTVRLYFFLALMGHQNIAQSPDANYVDTINTHIPFISMCQFIFYMGWMKVAEVLMNPFGDDDDDLEINWLIDRNLQVGMTIVDQMWEPPLIKDQFWMMKTPEPMYSVDAINERYNPQTGSVSCTNFRRSSTQMIMKEMLHLNSDSDLPSSECDGGRRNSALSMTVNDIRNAFKRRLSRLTSRVESVTDVESPVLDEKTKNHNSLHSSLQLQPQQQKQQQQRQRQQQQQQERRELSILHEEEENRKQNYGCETNTTKHFSLLNDKNDNKKPQNRQFKKKGQKLRKKMSKTENENKQKEEENNSINSEKISYDGDDEDESQIEEKLSTLSTHLEVIQAADNLPETIVDNYSNEMSVSKEYTTFKACNNGSSKFTRF
ncbi:Bestrophin RFP-TM chloride channel family protein [Brugia pahangi]